MYLHENAISAKVDAGTTANYQDKGVQKQICFPIGTVEAVENLLAEFFTK